MDIGAIMRIYNELKKAASDLQLELETIPKESDDRNLVESIIKAIQEYSKAFIDQELEVQVPKGNNLRQILFCYL